ncbi:MAG: DUF4175 family protein [Myxococcota bacterium]
MSSDSFQRVRDFLAELRRRLDRTAAGEALLTAIIALVTAGLVGTALATALGEGHGRWGWVPFAVGALVAGWAVVRLWWRPVRRRASDEEMARWLEDRVGGSHSAIITSVQAGRVLERGDDSEWPGFSPELARVTATRAARRLDAVEPADLDDRGRLLQLFKLGAGLAAVALALSVWSPDVFTDGWRHMFEGPPASAATGDEQVEEVDVAVGDLAFRLVYPAYLDLQPRDIPSSGGDLSALAGTEVRFTGSTLRPAKQVVLQLESDPESRWPVELSDEGVVRGAFRVGKTDRYRFLLTAPDGTLVRETRWRSIESRPDRSPEVRLLLPETDVEVNPQDRVQLLYEAADDHGLDRVHLVVDRGDGRKPERREVRSASGERTARGTEVLAVEPLDLEAGDAVEVWFEASDLNTVTGPGRSRSARRRVAMYSPDAEHEERLADLERLVDEMIDVLAERLESPVERADAGELPRYVAWQQKVSGLNGKMLASFEELLSSVSTDSLASDDLRETVRTTYDGLQTHHDQETSQLRQAVVGQGMERRPRQLAQVLHAVNEEGVTELEDGVWALKQELERSRQERLLDEGRDLMEAQNDLMGLLEQMKEGGDETLARDAERKLDDLLDSLRQMEQEMGRLAERTPYENQNLQRKRSDEEVDMESIRERVERVRELIRQGKMDEAMALLEELNRETQEMMAGLQSDFGGRQVASKAQEKMAEFQQKQREIEDGQRGVLEETGALDESMKERRRREMEEKAREAMEEARDKAAQIREELEGASEDSLHPADEEALEELRQKAREMEESLERGDVEPAREQAKEMSGECDGLGSEIGEGESRELDMERADDMQDAMKRLGKSGKLADDLASELDKLEQAMNRPPSAGEQREASRLQRLQQKLGEGAGDLQGELEELEEMDPGAKEALEPQLEEARRQMKEAGQRLGEDEPERATRHQREALQQLKKARESMDERRQRARSQEGDGEGPGVNDPRRKVSIPEEDDYRAPKAFRQEVLENMKERAPERYHDAIERYYEELVR